MKERINSDIIFALKNGEKEKVIVLRMVKSAIQETEKTNQIELKDEDVVQILTKQIKTRRESIEQFKAGNRIDLVEKTEKEIDIINHYMPKQLEESEIDQIIEQAFQEINPTCQRDIGPLMAKIMPSVKGKADMNLVNQKIKTKLGEV